MYWWRDPWTSRGCSLTVPLHFLVFIESCGSFLSSDLAFFYLILQPSSHPHSGSS